MLVQLSPTCNLLLIGECSPGAPLLLLQGFLLWAEGLYIGNIWERTFPPVKVGRESIVLYFCNTCRQAHIMIYYHVYTVYRHCQQLAAAATTTKTPTMNMTLSTKDPHKNIYHFHKTHLQDNILLLLFSHKDYMQGVISSCSEIPEETIKIFCNFL